MREAVVWNDEGNFSSLRNWWENKQVGEEQVFPPCWTWSSFYSAENKLGTNLLTFVFVWWLWEKILMYLNYICALHKPKYISGGFDWPTHGKLQWVPTSLVTKVFTTTAWAEVSPRLPLGNEGTPSMWGCVWQHCGKTFGCCSLAFCQCVPEEDLCITGGTGKVEPVCWPLERGGEGLSLARVMSQERLGYSGTKYVAVQGNEL